MADRRLAEALEHHRQGRLDEAAALYGALIAKQPRHADALNLLGVVALQKGDAEHAVPLIVSALEVRPETSDFHNNLGEAHRALGDIVAAEAQYREAVRLDPANADAHNNLALTLRAMAATGDAERHFREAIRLAPNGPRARANLGSLLRAEGRLEEAEAALREALDLAPDFVDAMVNLGNVLTQGERFDEALAVFARALALAPSHAEALVGMGTVRKELGEMAASTAAYRRAVAVAPGSADAHYNLAINLTEAGDIAASRQAYERALAIAPEMVVAQANLARLDLLDGRFGQGFERWQWRWREANTWQRTLPQPAWDGRPLGDGTLLVWAEQGVGDEVMLASVLPAAIAAAAHVVVECDARLVPLLGRSFPGLEVVAREETPAARLFAEDIAAQCALGDLCRWFRRDEAAFLPRQAYLQPDPDRVTAAQARLACLGEGPKVGIAWRSVAKGPGLKNRRFSAGKTLDLSAWEPVLRLPGVRFVNLQYGDVAGELAGLDVPVWQDPAVDQMASLEDFAAQIAALDLVISASNTTVHMAGALGQSVWTMVQAVPDWRWQRQRSDTLWYPAMRLYRQAEPGDWEGVVARVGEDLRRHLLEQ